MSKNMWMVRAGEGGYLFDEFKEKKVVAIGWNSLGDLSAIQTPEKLKENYKKAYSEDTEFMINAGCGQVRRFLFELMVGDNVITYDPTVRKYLVGEIVGGYSFNEKLLEYHHVHSVKWLGEVDRDDLSLSTRNSLGAISTLFKLNDESKQEILDIVDGRKKRNVKEEPVANITNETELKNDVVNQAQESIKDLVMRLDWDEMQELVAGILRAMGYKTIVSPPGSDRGRDIQASPDGLGLEDPRIFAEVKHRKGQMGSEEVRSFIAGIAPGGKGLYVSTGGFSKEAKYEADRSSHPVKLIDIDLLVKLLIQYYDNMDSDAKSLVPLIKIYWPA